MENGIIWRSKSPYNSPNWVLPKNQILWVRSNIVLWLTLNPYTLASFGTFKYFATLDLSSGFHQIKMIRLPFVLKNASASFQRFIDDELKPFISKITYVMCALMTSSSLVEQRMSAGRIYEPYLHDSGRQT